MALLLVVGGALAASAAPAPGQAAPPSTGPRDDGDAGAGPGAALAVTDAGSGVLRAGEQLRLRLEVTSRSPAELAGARVVLVAGSAVLPDSASLQRWADGQGPSRGDLVLADASLSSLRTGGSRPGVTAEVVADAQVLAGLGGSWGPRGLTVEVVDASGERLAAQRTFVTWLPPGWSPTSHTHLAVLVPLSAGPPDIGEAVVPPERLEELVAPDGRLRRTLAVATTPGASWQVDPAALGEPALRSPSPSAREDGGDDGGSDEGEGAQAPDPGSPAASWREDLAAAAPAHDVSVLPFGDPDPVTLAGAGAESLLGLADARGEELAAALPGGTSRLARTASPTLTTGSVEALGDAGRGVVVLAPGRPADRAGERAGDRAGDRAAAVQGEGGTRVDVRPRAGARSPAPPVRSLSVSGPATRALVAGTGPGGPQRPTPALTSARLVAESAALARRAPRGGGASMLLAPPAGWDVDPTAAVPVLDTVLRAPWVEPTSLTELAAQPAASTVRAPAVAAPTDAQLPREGLASVITALDRAASDAAVLSAPGAYVDAARASAVAAASSAWVRDLEGWRAGVEAYSEAASAIDDGVHVVPGSAVTVLSAQVDLPVTVVNDLDRAVDVTVSLDSSSPRLQPAGAQPIEGLAPGDRQRVLVPVRAVASGDVTAQVVLRADDGRQIGSPVELRVKVRADWESRGTAVAAGVVVLVLLLGVVRTVRRNRRRRAEASGPGSGPTTPRGSGGGGATEDLSVSTRGGPS